MLYRLFISLFSVVIQGAALTGNQKARKWIKGRINWRSKLESLPKNAILFHCASLGEFDQAVPLIQACKVRFPKVPILVSFFSPSGMEHYHKREINFDGVCYLPIDTKSNMNDFIRILRPNKIFLVKYEFWPNLINEAFSKNIPIYSVATSLRKNQLYFKWYGSFFRKSMRKVAHFFTQNIETNDLLNSIQCNNFTLVGDTRFETVLHRKSKQKPDEKLAKFMGDKRAIILGSAWEKEVEILATCFDKFKEEVIIIAPHEVNSRSIDYIKRLFPEAICYSDEFLDTEKKILILDTIGQLANTYAYGYMAFIGGGFHGGLHNILEPAVYGIPICFGPKHRKFSEARLFLSLHFAREIKNGEDLETFIIESKSNSLKERDKIQAFIQNQQGASQRILDYFNQ